MFNEIHWYRPWDINCDMRFLIDQHLFLLEALLHVDVDNVPFKQY